MDAETIDNLKKKYELKKQAINVDIPYSEDTEKQIETAIQRLYEDFLQGKNTSTTMYANIKTGVCSYKIYSCDFEGTTPEQLFSKIYSQHRSIEMSNEEKLHIHNGMIHGSVNNLLPEIMEKNFYEKGFSDDIYVYKGHNGITAIFDQYFADNRNPDDFLNEVTLRMSGKTLEEFKDSIGIPKTKQQAISMKDIVSHAINAGVTREQIGEVDNLVNTKETQEKGD